jgi:N-glycosylase/DNA lyase
MKLEAAIQHAKRMSRFRYRRLTVRHRIGRFIPQLSIPIAKRRHVAEAIEINKGRRTVKVLWVNVADIRSEQKCLHLDRLLWQLRRYARMQRSANRPAIVMVRGIPILWDGNHRVTSARLLGKRKIRCDVFFRLTHG